MWNWIIPYPVVLRIILSLIRLPGNACLVRVVFSLLDVNFDLCNGGDAEATGKDNSNKPFLQCTVFVRREGNSSKFSISTWFLSTCTCMWVLRGGEQSMYKSFFNWHLFWISNINIIFTSLWKYQGSPQKYS